MTATNGGRGFFPSLDALEVVLWPTLVLGVFVATAIAVDLVIALAARRRMLDRPVRRTGHALPIARGGGLVVVVTATLATLALAWRWPTDRPAILTGVLLPALMAAAMGLLDDARRIPAPVRLSVEAAIAAWITATLGPLTALAWPGETPLPLGPLAWPVTVLWIVSVVEALAAIEGIDGLSSLAAVIGGFVTLAAAWVSGSSVMVLMAAFVIASSGGLLVFNWDPSRILPGRAGSGFLGTMLAALPLALQPGDARSALVLPVALCLWPFIGDLAVSAALRIGRRRTRPDERPPLLVERLTMAGASHAQAALVAGALAAAGGLAGIWSLGRSASATGPHLAPLGAVLATVVVGTVILRLRPPERPVDVDDEHASAGS